MPPYDPNAKRPKLVPVDDDPAPVDAILGPDPAVDHPTPALTSVPAAPDDEPTSVPEPEAARPHLSVVPPDPAPARRIEAVATNGGGGGGVDLKKVLAVVVAVVTVIGAITVLRRRS